MEWTTLDFWIVSAGILASLSCALLGNFLILKRMSMMGDAISHSVLPGLAIAFFLTSSKASFSMFLGAAVLGVITSVLTQWIHKHGNVDQGASMGVVFTILFAIGLVLIVQAADSVDLDPGCVLYGAVEYIVLDMVTFSGYEIPRAIVVLTIVFLLNSCFVFLFFKELKITTFDNQYATFLGFNSDFMHYTLMGLVALTVVASFESVGSIIVIAMLIVPGASAYLLTDRLSVMILFSMVFAILSAVLGHFSAVYLPTFFGFPDTNTSGMIATLSGIIFFVIVVISPRYGLFSNILNKMITRFRIVQEDVLSILYRSKEENEIGATKEHILLYFIHHRLWLSIAMKFLEFKKKVNRQGKVYVLTAIGNSESITLMRSHRLWESYLSTEIRAPLSHFHDTADRLEHIHDPEIQKNLDLELPDSEFDPSGKKIPPELKD